MNMKIEFFLHHLNAIYGIGVAVAVMQLEQQANALRTKRRGKECVYVRKKGMREKWEICPSNLRAESRGGELTDNTGQQATGVGHQMRRKEFNLLPQTLPHRKHHNDQHLLQNLPERRHAHEILFRLIKTRQKENFVTAEADEH